MHRSSPFLLYYHIFIEYWFVSLHLVTHRRSFYIVYIKAMFLYFRYNTRRTLLYIHIMIVLCVLKMQLLISSGLTNKLRSGALWCRWHSGVQNHANAPRSPPTQSYEPHAGHEGMYLCLRNSISPLATQCVLHSHLH